MIRMYLDFKLKIICRFIINYIKYRVKVIVYKLNQLENDVLDTKLDAETIFIIGSGKSINNLSDEKWGRIKSNSSITFNNFIFHQFEPSVYISYIGENEDDKLENALIEKFKSWIKDKETTVIYKNIYSSSRSGLSRIRELITNSKVKIYSIFDLVNTGVRIENISNAIEFYNKIKILNTSDTFLSFRSTILTALSIAVSQQPKEIVILGCDLINSCYFWEAGKPNNSYKIEISDSMVDLISSLSPAVNQNNTHNTANTAISDLTLQDILRVVVPKYETLYRTKIYIYPKNKLLDFIEEYQWKP